MNTPAKTPGDKPTPDGGDPGSAPQKRGGTLLWLLLLVALLLLGWWWFSQRGISEVAPPAATDVTTPEPMTEEAASAEKAAAEARKKKTETAKSKPRKAARPAAARITEPRPLASRNPQPEYPRDAQRRGQSGRVLLRVDVAADGTATNVDFVQRSGSPDLDRAAMNAVRKWQFVPAKRNGKPVASSVNVPVDFVLPTKG